MPKECKTNACLEESFLECKMASGTWEGKNGDIEVDILGSDGDLCKLRLTIAQNNLNISKKSMECSVPLDPNANFKIEKGCQGNLKEFFE
jgi:hypothetical protein